MAFPFFGKKPEQQTPVAKPKLRQPTARPDAGGMPKPTLKTVPENPAPERAANTSTTTDAKGDSGLDRVGPRDELPVLSMDMEPQSELPDDYDLQSLDFTTTEDGNMVFGNQHMQISEVQQAMHPAAEQATMSFANGQDTEAVQVLEAAIAAGGELPELLWRMLFDLYQFTNQRDAFEARGVDYAVIFEKSPPSWQAPDKQSAGSHAGAPLVSLSGTLTEASAGSIEQLRRLGERAKELRIDVARVRDVDEAGGNLLIATIQSCKQRKLPVYLVNAPALAALLEKKVQPGEARGESLWNLLLETYQQLGRHESFEELALNYAITFEKSPPSWEPKAVVTKEVAPPPSARPAPEALVGDVLGASQDAFAGLVAAAEESDTVLIDCSGLRRMDFVSAGTLLNLVGKWQIAGKPVRIIKPNALIEGLFTVLGIAAMATIDHGKKP